MPTEHVMVIGMPTQNISADTEYLASGDVMTLIRVSRRTLERYVADGKLTVSYLPSGQRRYRRADVEALLTKTAPADSPDPKPESAGASLRQAS